MIAYITTVVAIVGAANLLSYLLRRDDTRFRWIVFTVSIPVSFIAAYYLVQ